MRYHTYMFFNWAWNWSCHFTGTLTKVLSGPAAYVTDAHLRFALRSSCLLPYRSSVIRVGYIFASPPELVFLYFSLVGYITSTKRVSRNADKHDRRHHVSRTTIRTTTAMTPSTSPPSLPHRTILLKRRRDARLWLPRMSRSVSYEP